MIRDGKKYATEFIGEIAVGVGHRAGSAFWRPDLRRIDESGALLARH
jgi:hypothetical protein